jgi:Gpi18-like mannosyltransferase
MKDTHKALLIGLSSRILVVAVFVFCSVLFTVSSGQPAAHLTNPLPLVHLFDRYDSGYYISIATNGYATMLDWNFFPLYPVAIKAVSLLFTPFFVTNVVNTQNAVELAGFIVSSVAFFVSMYFFYKLTNKIFESPQIALVATAFYSFWGGAVFYSAIYSEALFMALALGTFYYLEEDKLPIAVLLGFLAAFTRSNGFLVLIPFLIYALQSIKNKSKTIKLLACSALVASPFLIFQLIGYMFAGGAFPITVIAHNLWPNYHSLPTQLTLISNYSLRILTFYVIGLALIFMPTAYFISRLCSRSIKNNLIQDAKQLKYWAFYASTIFVILLDQSSVSSIIRYAVPMLPIYWVSATIYTKNRTTGIIIFAVMTGMLIIGSYMFETGGSFM